VSSAEKLEGRFWSLLKRTYSSSSSRSGGSSSHDEVKRWLSAWEELNRLRELLIEEYWDSSGEVVDEETGEVFPGKAESISKSMVSKVWVLYYREVQALQLLVGSGSKAPSSSSSSSSSSSQLWRKRLQEVIEEGVEVFGRMIDAGGQMLPLFLALGDLWRCVY